MLAMECCANGNIKSVSNPRVLRFTPHFSGVKFLTDKNNPRSRIHPFGKFPSSQTLYCVDVYTHERMHIYNPHTPLVSFPSFLPRPPPLLFFHFLHLSLIPHTHSSFHCVSHPLTYSHAPPFSPPATL